MTVLGVEPLANLNRVASKNGRYCIENLLESERSEQVGDPEAGGRFDSRKEWTDAGSRHQQHCRKEYALAGF
jgi:hypothetical protein